MPSKAESAPLNLPSWRTPANRADWLILGATGGYWIWNRYREWRNTNRDTILRFSPDDTPYYWLLRWLERMPRQESLSVFRVMSPNGESGGQTCEAPMIAGEKRKVPLPVLVPTEGVSFKFRGVKCTIERSDPPSGNSNDRYRQRADLTLRIESRDPEISIALLEEISHAAVGTKESPKVYVFQWNWIAVRACPTGRAAILPEGEYQSLSTDLRDFFDSEAWYRDVGLPYRRGFLLHGIAGSGKTTTVIALAGDFGLNVCVLSLSSHNDQTLLEAVRAMPSNSILLLEDIDCAWDEDRKTKDDKPLTFSGLLNVLDGAATPEGRVTFMTTNAREKLDAALIRPGRVDKELEFRHATVEQIEELSRRFSPNHRCEIPGSEWASEKVSMAQVQERLIQKYRTPQRERFEVVA